MGIVKGAFSSENKYTHLLIVLVAIFFTAPFVRAINGKFPLIMLFFYFAIIMTLRALDLKRPVFRTLVLLGGGALLIEVMMDVFAGLRFSEDLAICSLVLYSAFMVNAIILMVRKMFEHVRVTGDTIRGGVCIYLLMGYLWTVFYFIINVLDTNAFHFVRQKENFDLFYFSFVSLTTIGFGDIYPVNKIAMTLSCVEATVGQLYLTIFIARLVGLHIVHQVSKK